MSGVVKGQIAELTVDDLAFGGKGIARIDGFTVFVNKTVPKDKVRVCISKKKKNYAEAKLLEILEPSPFRITPPCRYSGYCGGCTWQHLDYEKQLSYKTSHVRESLEHIGGIFDAVVHPALPSCDIFGYRNKMEYTCSEKRWVMPDEFTGEDMDIGFGIGLHAPGVFNKVIDIEGCLLQNETGSGILRHVRAFIKRSGLPVYNNKSHVGFWRFLMIRHSGADGSWMVNVVTSCENSEIMKHLARELTELFPEVISIVNNITSKRASVSTGEKEILIYGQSYITDRLGEYTFKISANSFFQTNTKGAENLYRTVERYADLSGHETVLDLYSGTGTIPIWLSSYAKEVTGVEIVDSAVADAVKNCTENGVDNCRFIKGDIKDTLPGLDHKPDVIIIDPPRSGMHGDVVSSVLDLNPEKLVYVSCNPSTLARDAALLKEKYRVVEVQPVDMFPHTYHIESVARFERNFS